ncbi:MAG: GGDEF domain-containing protein [Alteromonas sp.]|uniref:GGDEF domain-containing protein n=1 Tax=Alteromonas sp. TaxID=232 RepID=UPI0032D8CF4B
MQANKAKERVRLRIALIIGALIVACFMVADFFLLPKPMHQIYLYDRLFVQIPIILVALVLSFWRHFSHYRAYIFTTLLVALTYSNYWVIWVCWQEYQFAFPYEGTILYAFYCVFALGIPFRFAITSAVINVIGFIVVMWLAPAYGDRMPISVGFVAASLFTCSYAKYRLDRSLTLLKKTNDRLTKLSKFDPLSDLLNRRALRNQSENLLAYAKRHKVSLAVIMLDLDDFKAYNDHFGHQQGDEAIRQQSSILRGIFKRETDIIGRYGGEEFVVVLSDVNEEQLKQSCQKILQGWEETNLAHAPNAAHPFISCSIGAVITNTPGDASIDSLIGVADKALYKAKDKGKACYELAAL